MQVTPQAAHTAPRNTAPITARKIPTEELADLLLIRPQTVRAGYCRNGHYLGMVPVKLANRRLLWDSAEVDALIAGRPVRTPDAADLDKHFARKAADVAKIPEHIAAKRAAKLKPTGEGDK